MTKTRNIVELNTVSCLSSTLKAFTIVEILIVIVAIGVLAAVTFVSYSGISSRANIASIQSDLDANARKLQLYYTQYGSYPSILDGSSCPSAPVVDNNYCLKLTSGNVRSNYSATTSTFKLSISKNSLIYSITESTSPAIANFGTLDNPAKSCYSLKLGGFTTDGVYWIDPDKSGPNSAFQVYCDQTYSGGGWTLLLKATRGNTFSYGTNYWTTSNTLNDTDLTLNDADAKYRSFNELDTKDLMARWPDINSGSYRWLHNGFYADSAVKLPTFFSTVDRYFIADAKTHPNWSSGIFSSQADVRFYGFNYHNNPNNARSRWGFGWNENGGGLYPSGNMDSDDASGGIGLEGIQQNTTLKYSAGDVIGCCTDSTGINRSARVEMYGRNTSDPAD